MRPVMSKKMEKYFDKIIEDVNHIYDIAGQARKKGLDPWNEVECPPAHDMAGRVENLVGPQGVAERIRELKNNGQDQDHITFKIAEEIIEGKFGEYPDPEKVDRAIRVALAIKTEGVVSAPLEGISSIKIRPDLNGGPSYLSLYFAGPIRAAGGTVQAFAVLISDYVREKMKIAPYIPTQDEVERMVEEVKLYDRLVNLQYPSTIEELKFAFSHLKVELNGDPTEGREVSAYRNMKRIETNVVRSGPCLVLNDGVLLKSKKIMKVIDKMKIQGWEWLKEVKKYSHTDDDNKKKEKDAEETKEGEYGSGLYDGKRTEQINQSKETKKINETPVEKRKKYLEEKVPPVYKYIADVIGGRPVFAYPSRVGGHRIRYGRSRNTGLAACGMNPNTMYIMNEFLAVGTQIRIERPGKSASVMPVTSIEGPVCLLENGDVYQFSTPNEFKKIIKNNPIKKILFLGDILFGFGEFAENNHTLLPSGYVEEWWAEQLRKIITEKNIDLSLSSQKNELLGIKSCSLIDINNWIENPFDDVPTGVQALELSKILNIPLHPHYLYHYGNLNGYELIDFRNQIKDYYYHEKKKFSDDSKLKIPNSEICRNFLYKCYCPHKNKGAYLELDEDLTLVFIEIFGLEKIFSSKESEKIDKTAEEKIALDMFEYLTSIKIMDKSPYYMGTRMGRPEKAKERKMKPPVHALFPLGHDTENSRVVQNEVCYSSVDVDIVVRQCPECGTVTHENFCNKCNKHTELKKVCSQCHQLFDVGNDICPNCQIPLNPYMKRKITCTDTFNDFVKKMKTSQIPNVKAVKGLSSEFKMPEPIEKGILRAKNDVYIFKDGTIRFDALDIPFTHFTPREIDCSIEKLHEMGYDTDYLGNPLTDSNQVCELKCQDFIATEHCGDYFVRVANFIDDELDLFYGLDRFYNCENRQDLIGHLFAGLAPHTSAAIVGRLIGFTPISAGYGHPYWHAAKRRNCFPGNNQLLLKINGELNRVSLKDLYEKYYHDEQSKDNYFRKSNSYYDIKVISFDTDTNVTKETKLLEVIKTPSTNNIIEFKLRTGRSYCTIPDHPILIYENEKIVKKRAFEVNIGDYFVIPSLILDNFEDYKNFDLLFELNKDKFRSSKDKIMLRGINEFIKILIEKMGLAETSKILNINKKTLKNYYGKRDSVPFSIVLKLINYYKIPFSEIPNCSLGFKGDHTFIPRYIQINESLMKLIGYYIAEGFYRQHDRGFQVDFAATEKDIRNDIENSIRETFGDGFKIYRNSQRFTIGSHILYFIFKNIFKLSNSARTKRIPSFFIQLPKYKLAKLLSSCFSGDGSVDSKQPNISYSTFSVELAKDIDTALLRFEIFSTISSYNRDNHTEYKIRIYGENYKKYNDQIGFTSKRKTKEMIEGNSNLKIREMPMFKNHKLVPIISKDIIPAKDEFVYSINSENYHNLLINENILTHNCDGDEDGLLLLTDCLLNFSRYYLPAKIGGKMDAPLVLSVTLDPNEVDGEAHNVDTLPRYPLEFYEKTLEYAKPGDIEKDLKMDLIKSRLGKPEQYEGIKFTHPTININFGPKLSIYKQFETMNEKIESQLDLAVRISSVDAEDVARKILSTHFIRDIMGNLRKFSSQGFRCVSCQEKYRRVPLSGVCNKCGGKLLLTVTKGGIVKYLDKSLEISKTFDLGAYTTQRMELISEYVTSLTDNPRIKQKRITSYFK